MRRSVLALSALFLLVPAAACDNDGDAGSGSADSGIATGNSKDCALVSADEARGLLGLKGDFTPMLDEPRNCIMAGGGSQQNQINIRIVDKGSAAAANTELDEEIQVQTNYTDPATDSKSEVSISGADRAFRACNSSNSLVYMTKGSLYLYINLNRQDKTIICDGRLDAAAAMLARRAQ